MSCECNCHASSGGFKLTCTVDKGSSGVPGLSSCTPCSEQSSLLCPMKHDQPAEAVMGVLCLDHYARLRETLQDILEFWALLPLHLVPGSAVDDGSKHISKKPDPPAPGRLDVMALTDPRTDDTEQRVSLLTHGPKLESNGAESLPSIPSVLHGWVVMVCEERNLTPCMPTVLSSVDFLRDNLEWIAGDDMLWGFDASLRSLRRTLAASHGERPKQPVGKCPSLNGDGKPCDGPLWPADGIMAVDCGRCGRHFDERFLRHLGGMLSVPSGTMTA